MKKQYVYIGLAALAIGGLYWYNKNKSQNTQATTTSDKNVDDTPKNTILPVNAPLSTYTQNVGVNYSGFGY